METIIVAAKMTKGKSLKKPVKYKVTNIINSDEITPAKGVFAPASALTTVRDKLPVTGKAVVKPALILARPNAMSS